MDLGKIQEEFLVRVVPNIPGGDFVALDEGGGGDKTIDSRQGYAFLVMKSPPFAASGGNLPGDGLNQAGA